MRDIKRRLEKPEQATKPVEDRECIVFLCGISLEGEPIALEGNGIRVTRVLGETEKQLHERVSAEVKKTKPMMNGKIAIFMLHEVCEKSERDDEVSKYPGVARVASERKLDPVRAPEPKPEPRPLPREVIEVKNMPGAVSGHWMLG